MPTASQIEQKPATLVITKKKDNQEQNRLVLLDEQDSYTMPSEQNDSRRSSGRKRSINIQITKFLTTIGCPTY